MSFEPYETELVWAGINIEVRFTRNWMNGTAHHLELRAGEPLSVIATGYRSRFLPSDLVIDTSDLIDFVLEWLEEAAQSRDWQDHVDRKRQGDLFDL